MEFNALSYAYRRSTMERIFYFLAYVDIVCAYVTLFIMIAVHKWYITPIILFILIGVVTKVKSNPSIVGYESLVRFTEDELIIVSKNREFAEIVIQYDNICSITFDPKSEDVTISICNRIEGTTLDGAHVISVDKKLLHSLSNSFYSYTGEGIKDIPEDL